jgi:hypothetical protein
MATVSKITYDTPGSLTITLASLASSATVGQISTAVDNSTTLYDDVIIGGKITAGTTPTVNTQIEIWVYASYDGTTYTALGTTAATNGSFTIAQQNKTYMRIGAVLPTTVATTGFLHTYVCPSLVSLFGVMPQKWGVFVIHNSVAALNATAGNHEVKYTGITYTST